MSYRWNEHAVGLSCLRCGAIYAPHDPICDQNLGCPACLVDGYPVSLYVIYDEFPQEIRTHARGMARFVDWLPFTEFISPGEGGTPLVEVPILAQEHGVARLWIKNEGQNPTGSHKDRMSTLAVARAAMTGRETVTAASSGNAGVSLAAYAAAYGLNCVIVTTDDMSLPWAGAIHAHAAEIHVTENSRARWDYMRKRVEESNWYPVTNFIMPPVGSNPFGVQGYKTIAHEIAEALTDEAPTVVIIPTARGDLLWGVHRGFMEMQYAGIIDSLPRLIAVETASRLKRVLEGEDYRQEFARTGQDIPSIDVDCVTYQAMIALQQSGGDAVSVNASRARAAQRSLAREGFYAENASATVLPALQNCISSGKITSNDRVV
ncbi:MAG TPA: pyridoxal-phosphate dependent enzyme, partial [Aggregatilineales bacterium]|nr:pyridoxal-phosphate dependent enzyme [Aggregatilineales bacterium]